ncbi:MAG: methionyl-tRNA formyltransferase [Wenzhouxiangella sp.]
MRILFAGTPDFAVPALVAMIESGRFRPRAVLTQPDRPAGRGRRLRPGPVKRTAIDAGIEVLQPSSLKSASSRDMLAAFAPDLIVTAAYGLILPAPVLEMPRHGCWNLHASLLPRWRGASPVNQAILAGDDETGVSLMQMDTGLDTGPVLLKRATAIGPEETAGQLHDRLALIAADLAIDALRRLEGGTLPEPEIQDERRATHAPLIKRSDARLDWNEPAEVLARMVRGYHPWPVAHAELEGREVRIHRARAADDGGGRAPGSVIDGSRDVVRVACGRGVLEILELQEAGRRRVSARDWWNARRAAAQD